MVDAKVKGESDLIAFRTVHESNLHEVKSTTQQLKRSRTMQKTEARCPEKSLRLIKVPRGQPPLPRKAHAPKDGGWLHNTGASISSVPLTGYTIRTDPNAFLAIRFSFITIKQKGFIAVMR